MFHAIRNRSATAINRRDRNQLRKEETRTLDALALTEIGFPPKKVQKKQRSWFYYL